MRNAQISIEYLIVTGLVVALVIIPATLFFYSSSNRELAGSFSLQKANDLGNGIVTTAEQIYYLGPYSKKTRDFDIPRDLDKLYLARIVDGSDEYHYVVIVMQNGAQQDILYYQSEVPLTSGISAYVDTSLSHPEISECSAPVSCSFHTFIEPITKRGVKTFKFETILEGNVAKAAITPLID